MQLRRVAYFSPCKTVACCLCTRSRLVQQTASRRTGICFCDEWFLYLATLIKKHIQNNAVFATFMLARFEYFSFWLCDAVGFIRSFLSKVIILRFLKQTLSSVYNQYTKKTKQKHIHKVPMYETSINLKKKKLCHSLSLELQIQTYSRDWAYLLEYISSIQCIQQSLVHCQH